jgi:mRNA-degrading endonuclease HigB of HigAB toxin-antitoxin module
MLVIGLSRLKAYGALHPEAEPSLKALHALLSVAAWRSLDELLRQWPGIARHEGGCVRIGLVQERCEVLLQVNFAREIIQIQAVEAFSPEGANSDARQRAADPDTGGLRTRPA